MPGGVPELVVQPPGASKSVKLAAPPPPKPVDDDSGSYEYVYEDEEDLNASPRPPPPAAIKSAQPPPPVLKPRSTVKDGYKFPAENSGLTQMDAKINAMERNVEELQQFYQRIGHLSDEEIQRLLRRAGGSRCSHCGRKEGKVGGVRPASSSRYDTHHTEYSYTYETVQPEDEMDATWGQEDGTLGPELVTQDGRNQRGSYQSDRFRYDIFVREWQKQTNRAGVDSLLRKVANSRLARIGRRQDAMMARYDELPELLEIQTQDGRRRRRQRQKEMKRHLDPGHATQHPPTTFAHEAWTIRQRDMTQTA